MADTSAKSYTRGATVVVVAVASVVVVVELVVLVLSGGAVVAGLVDSTVGAGVSTDVTAGGSVDGVSDVPSLDEQAPRTTATATAVVAYLTVRDRFMAGLLLRSEPFGTWPPQWLPQSSRAIVRRPSDRFRRLSVLSSW
jgi:hypothetical protein